MGFSKEVSIDVMVACARNCCVCHQAKGTNIEIHHIVPAAEGGADTFENAIPLCFDCHAAAGHYNDDHPKGKKFSRPELFKHRDTWYQMVRENKIPPTPEYFDNLKIDYLVSKEYLDQELILHENLSTLPIQNALLVKNQVYSFYKSFRNSEQDLALVGSGEGVSYPSMERYSELNPSAEIIDKSGPHFPSLYSARIPSNLELANGVFDINQFEKLLIDQGVDPSKYFRIFVYQNNIYARYEGEDTPGCGMDGKLLEERYSEAMTIIQIDGTYTKNYFTKDRLVLNIVENGRLRQTRGTYHLKLTSRNEFTGDFESTAADSKGDVKLKIAKAYFKTR